MSDLTKKELEELTRKVMERSKDLQKFELISRICDSFFKREFGDDPELVAPVVLAFIGGVITNDVSKVRKAMSTLKMEKFLSGLAPYKLEKFFKGGK